jgi:hypothetical protein
MESEDTLKIIQNSDGSYSMDWDKQDPNWKWMNDLTSKEIEIIMKNAIEDYNNEL